MCFISLQKRTLTCNKSSSIQTRNQNMPEHCASRSQYTAGRCRLHLATQKGHRPLPRHLLSSVFLIFHFNSSLFLHPALRFSTSFLIQHLCHPLSLSLQSSQVPSSSFLLPDASEGSIKDSDRACISSFLSFSLPFFALLRMADYRSLHGLSGADTQAQLEREAEDERRRGCCLSLIHIQKQRCQYEALTGHKSFIHKVTWELVTNIGEIHTAHFL